MTQQHDINAPQTYQQFIARLDQLLHQITKQQETNIMYEKLFKPEPQDTAKHRFETAFKIVTSIISAIMIVAIVYIAQRIQMQEHKANQEIYLIDQKIQTYDTHQHLQNHPLNMTKKQ